VYIRTDRPNADPGSMGHPESDWSGSPFGFWDWLRRTTPATAAGSTTQYDPAVHPWSAAIQLFGGQVVDPAGYPRTAAGFQDYLNATGVQYFPAAEMLTPHRKSTARRLGYSILLPKHDWWPRGAALAKLADKLRALVGRPVRMRNWWRPSDYNKAVGGASASDHINALSVDLDYGSANDRRAAERMLKQLRSDNSWLRMSLGLGNVTTHVGLLSSRGERTWHYKSYRR